MFVFDVVKTFKAFDCIIEFKPLNTESCIRGKVDKVNHRERAKVRHDEARRVHAFLLENGLLESSFQLLKKFRKFSAGSLRPIKVYKCL